MSNWSPITPPDELFNQWFDNWRKNIDLQTTSFDFYVAIQAARWGADQELKACEMYLAQSPSPTWAKDLRETRRPKPPSLKEQAISEVAGAVAGGNITPERGALIRRALPAPEATNV